MPSPEKIQVTLDIINALIAEQFPQWANLKITPVRNSGWDNITFHLGDSMLIRMPSAQCYVAQVEKEQHWLPKLAPHLPLRIPKPLALGVPNNQYPWHWSIYEWIEGAVASKDSIDSLPDFATDLGHFLKVLQAINTTDAPTPGAHNFYRGGLLKTYAADVEQSINILRSTIDVSAVQIIWNKALSSQWQSAPVWLHGDIAPGNLLTREGKLSAVIDFGCCAVGDPACDLAIAWTFFDTESRARFKAALSIDENTWARGKGWALWKALLTCAQLPGSDPSQYTNARKVIETLLNID